jgi:hypothetical protein
VPWLVISVGLSVILTVVVNVGLRAFPGAGQRIARSLTTFTSPGPESARTNDRRVRVVVPWKAMLIASVILSVVLSVWSRIV